MKSLKRTLAAVLAAAAIALTATSGFSYAYNPWTTMTGEKTLGITPFVYTTALDPLGLGADLVLNYGITANIDVFVDVAGVSILPGFSYNYSWIMARYDFGGNNIAAIQASLTAVSAQYHYFWENEMIALEANALVEFTYSSLATPAFKAYLAPVYKITKDFAFYVEVDPAYTVGGSFALGIVPGIYLGLGAAGMISVAVPLGDVLSGITPNVGLWYYLPIKL